MEKFVLKIYHLLTRNIFVLFAFIGAVSLVLVSVLQSQIPFIAFAAAPDAINSLLAYPGQNQVSLRWDVPLDGGQPITDYIVEYGVTGGFPGNATVFADGVSTIPGAIVTGLDFGSDYSFRVSAVNIDGTGGVGNTETATPGFNWELDPQNIMPAGLQGSAAVVFGTKIYLFGGIDDTSGVVDRVFVYDPAAAIGSRWTEDTTDPLPSPRSHGQAISDGTLIYYIMGIDSSGGGGAVDTVLIYDPNAADTARWSTGTSAGGGNERHSFAAAYDGTDIFVIAGTDSGDSDTDSVFSYNPVGDAWTVAGYTVVPNTLIRPTGGLSGGTIYVANDGDLYTYVIATDTWAQLSSLPDFDTPTAPCSVFNGNNFYHISGANGIDNNRTYTYHTTLNSWFAGPELAIGRKRCAAVVLDNILYAFGGHDQSGTGYPSDTFATLDLSLSPLEPILVSPVDGGIKQSSPVDLTARYFSYTNPIDSVSNNRLNVRVNDSSLANCASGADIDFTGQSGASASILLSEPVTASIAGLVEGTTYYWCASNDDGTTQTAFAPMGTFMIDSTIPGPTYSTYIGGSSYDSGYAIEESGGIVYIGGTTNSADFPTTVGAFDETLPGGNGDGFVLAIDPSGNGTADMVFATYLGGTIPNSEGLSGLAVEGGSIYVAGYTQASDFPVAGGGGGTPFDSTINGTFDAFFSQLNLTGDTLIYSTFLGAGLAYDLDVDGSDIFIVGLASAGFPTGASVGTPYDTTLSGSDFFIFSIDPSGNGASDLLYSTYLGGTSSEQSPVSVAASGGRAYLVAGTSSNDYPTVATGTPFDATYGGGSRDGVFSVLDPAGGGASDLEYSTYLGGNNFEQLLDIDVSGASVYITGTTESTDYPTTLGAFDTTVSDRDIVVSVITPLGGGATDLLYSTYIGGSAGEEGYGIGVESGKVYITGYTNSTDLPVTLDAYQATLQVDQDAFLFQIDPAGGGSTDIEYGSYLGSTNDINSNGDWARDIFVSSSMVYITGQTYGSDFPAFSTVGTPFDTTANSDRDVFFTQFDFTTPPTISAVGSETQANTTTSGDQYVPVVAMDSTGNFVIAWTDDDGTDGDFAGVFAQRFNNTGVAQGSEFQVNTTTSGDQNQPSIAMSASGDFVIAWTDNDGTDGASEGVFAQRYNSSGVAQGGEFQVNTTTAGGQFEPNVGMDDSGNFIIAWTDSNDSDGDQEGVFAQRFTSAGATVGGEFQANTTSAGPQLQADVDMGAGGEFVIMWADDNDLDGDGAGIFGQLYTSSGATVGSEFQVNTTTTANQWNPRPAMDDSGNFVGLFNESGSVAWSRPMFQRFNNLGVAQGAETLVDPGSNQSNDRENARITIGSAGEFYVAWSDFDGRDGDNGGVFAHAMNSDGSFASPEFQVNTTTAGDQGSPDLSSNGSDIFVIAWTDESSSDGDGSGIFFQMYNNSAITPPPPPPPPPPGGGSSSQVTQQQQQGTLPIPTIDKATPISTNSIQFDWIYSGTNQTGFKIYGSDMLLLKDIPGTSIRSVQQTSYKANTLVSGHKLSAYNSTQESSKSVAWPDTFTLIESVTPVLVSRIGSDVTIRTVETPTNLKKGKSGVQFELHIDDEVISAVDISSLWTQNTTYTFTGIDPEVPVEVRARSRNQVEVETPWSASLPIPAEDILAATLSVSLSLTTIDGNPLPAPVNPEETIFGTILVSNTGSETADNVFVDLPIPEYLFFVPGSLQVEGSLQSDGADGDAGQTSNNFISAIWPELPAGESRSVSFQLRFDQEPLRILANPVIEENERDEFVLKEDFLEGLPQDSGRDQLIDDADLQEIFEEIANELPLAIVQASAELQRASVLAAVDNPQLVLQATASASNVTNPVQSNPVVVEPNLVPLMTQPPVVPPVPPVPPTPPTPKPPTPPSQQKQGGSQPTSQQPTTTQPPAGGSLLLTAQGQAVAELIEFSGTTSEPNSTVTVVFNGTVTRIVTSDANGVWRTFVSADELGIGPGESGNVSVESIAHKDDLESNRVLQTVSVIRAIEGEVVVDIQPQVTGQNVIQEIVVENEQPIQRTLIATAPIVVIASVPLWGYLPYVPTLLYHFIIWILGLFSKKKEGEQFGIVYNSITKEPLPLAIIRIYNKETNKLITTEVTDKQGRYEYLLPPGEYRIEVKKPQYNFPSKIVNIAQDGDYLNVYRAEAGFTVGEGLLSLPDIPVDPFDAKRRFSLANLIKKGWLTLQAAGHYLALPVLFVGAAISLFMVYTVPSLLNWILAILYVFMFILQLVLREHREHAWGVVYEVATNAPLPLASLQLIDPEFGKVVKSRLSDYQGRFAFLPEPGRYVIKSSKEGYMQADVVEGGKDRHPISGEIQIQKEGEHLSGDIAMTTQETNRHNNL